MVVVFSACLLGGQRRRHAERARRVHRGLMPRRRGKLRTDGARHGAAAVQGLLLGQGGNGGLGPGFVILVCGGWIHVCIHPPKTQEHLSPRDYFI